MTQVVEYLPNKCEVLSSNPSTEKKKKKESLLGRKDFWKRLPPSWELQEENIPSVPLDVTGCKARTAVASYDNA
jgi:hypothetical protein